MSTESRIRRRFLYLSPFIVGWAGWAGWVGWAGLLAVGCAPSMDVAGGDPTPPDAGGSGSGTGGALAGSGGSGGPGGSPGTGGSGSGGSGTGGGASTGGASGTGGRAGTGGTATGGAGGRAGTGGAGAGGRAGTGGAGTGGRAGTGGGTGAGGSTASGTEPTCTWPTATSTTSLGTSTMNISGSFDGGMRRFTGQGGTQTEGQPPLFMLSNGATISNVIIGNPAGDGIHCSGTCTVKNVWWEDVGEDAATLLGTSTSQTMTIDGGGARGASDKVFQHNGPGTMVIRNFCISDFGKLYRSCGNCSRQYKRSLLVENVSVTPSGATSTLAGVNTNYGDVATFHGIFIHGRTISICQRYTGNSTGAEPVSTGSGPDGTYCVYDAARDIIYR